MNAKFESFLNDLEAGKTNLKDYQHDNDLLRFPLGLSQWEEIKKNHELIYNTLKKSGDLREHQEVFAVCIVIVRTALEKDF